MVARKEELHEEPEDVRIKNMGQLVDVLIDEINLLRKNKITPSRANAMANLNGKIMQAVKLSVECEKYVQKLDGTASNIPLLSAAEKNSLNT